jgi:hypothetical protein
MKTVTVLFRSIALGACLLAANAFAVSNLIQVESPQYNSYGTFVNNGIIYNVPAGANFEWEIQASGSGGAAHIILGGGGLNVNQYVSGGGDAYDVGSTAYADTVYYQTSANASGSGDYAHALFFIGW